MRYLSKIIFINSASIKYSEINVDGNVHFIGTQGVGKSTLLRALLFFYNANQQKLGIPVGKKSFVEFYLPYQDSYIIYEVIRETGPYCILVFKSQGRACYRFIDTHYDKKYFINNEGRANETWDKLKLSFGKEISYTRKIDKYDDYRNILYGNSQGVGAEFRKYSILESKQYQNIPRAIQHVFLNYKVESEFIKDTIIKSLNEEEINIDLSNYSHHLKDFDTQLTDIKKWTDRTKSGEIIVRKQAETVATIFLAIKFLSREKEQLARTLVWQFNEIKNQQPKISEKLQSEEAQKFQLGNKISEIDKKFQTKKDKITAEISVYESKIKEAKEKYQLYENININGISLTIENIIQRVAKKKERENERDDFNSQKEVLEARFIDIKQKYEAQINQLTNQLSAFENAKQTDINILNENLFQLKEKLVKEYDKLVEDIKKQHLEELQFAKNLLEEKKQNINNLQISKAEIKHKRYYEIEIEKYTHDINNFEEKIRISENEITLKADEEVTLKKQWEIEKDRVEEIASNKREKFIQQISSIDDQIVSISDKLENSKNSFYGWLNKEYPGWQKTIGKVIDEDTILFKSGLSPEKVSSDFNFYGIRLDLSEIDKTVKTVSDYENDKAELKNHTTGIQKNIITLAEQLSNDVENLKRKYQQKISKCKDVIRNNEYINEQHKIKLNEAKVNIKELINKAASDKQSALNKIDHEIQLISEAKLNAENEFNRIENISKKQIENRKKDKKNNVDAAQKKVDEVIALINSEVQNKKIDTHKKINILKEEQKKEFNDKGAETKKILNLEIKISEVATELEFIGNNTSITERYKYDKEQLFDKVQHFKNQKTNFENQLGIEQDKHHTQRLTLIAEIDILKSTILVIAQQLANIAEDLQKHKLFELTDCYKSIKDLSAEPTDEFRTEKRCIILIEELNNTHYKGIDRYRELQEAINKFNGNFHTQNIFKFKLNLIEQSEFFQFAEDLKEFIDEDKISLYEKRVNELFADIIKQVGKETTELLSKEGEIRTVISDINKDFVKRNFAGVIKSIELRVAFSANKVVHLLMEIKKFNDENINDLGEANLFSNNEQTRETKNKKAVGLLSLLVKEISNYKHNDIHLSDSFELEFKIVENDNDTNWVQNLANVGSDGTDVLVKAMINIMLLNVFKEGATKNRFKDFRLHCMMDEIGKLHPTNVRGILKFANDRNINLINSSPQSFDALAYRYTYKLAKDDKSVTIINRLITNNRERQ
ncbi:MAG: ATP-binding protein [Bacteroidia bacterium]|nr:ATP-binding protein [Bacteroidia bacterium]